MLKCYNCPYDKFHTKEEWFCKYCNNHGIRLVTDENDDGKKIHLQLSNELCPTCEGLGYIAKDEEYISERFGKKRKITNKLKLICGDCQGYKYVLNIVNFYDCNFKNNEGSCVNGKVLKWSEPIYKFYEIPFWFDFIFKENVEQLILHDCLKCHGTSHLEEYSRISFTKDED